MGFACASHEFRKIPARVFLQPRVFFTERSRVITRDTGIFCSYLEDRYCQASMKMSCKEGEDVCVYMYMYLIVPLVRYDSLML